MTTETPQEAALKRCSKCHEVKPLEAFHRNRSNPLGREYTCRHCKCTPSFVAAEEQKLTVPNGMKRCTLCAEVKPLEMFSRDKRARDGATTRCKKCAAILSDVWYQSNQEKARIAQNERYYADLDRSRLDQRARYHANPDKARASSRTWYWANRESVSASGRTRREKNPQKAGAWYWANRGKARDYNRAWRDANPEKIRAWRDANRERLCDYDRAWSRANPDKARAKNHARRARKAGNGGSYTMDEMHALEASQNGHCAYCDRTGYALHIEHIHPIAQGGPSWIWNLCLACRKCNLSKGNRTPAQWINRWYLKGDTP